MRGGRGRSSRRTLECGRGWFVGDRQPLNHGRGGKRACGGVGSYGEAAQRSAEQRRATVGDNCDLGAGRSSDR